MRAWSLVVAAVTGVLLVVGLGLWVVQAAAEFRAETEARLEEIEADNAELREETGRG